MEFKFKIKKKAKKFEYEDNVIQRKASDAIITQDLSRGLEEEYLKVLPKSKHQDFLI